ncbi:MAG: LysR family transcriptional regulator [Lachnospiraceae bacterium]|nr:LysR family transcriptional regulator [Lachnospiraceae bacterium]
MELLQLRYFCTAARMLNISHAAIFHSIPQPAMSKTISKLEDELGVKLFTRQKNHIYLTSEGKAFYKNVVKALSLIDEASSGIRSDAACNKDNNIRFNLMISALQAPMSDFLASFHNNHPDISFETSKYPLHTDTEAYYDLCICVDRPSPEYDMSIPIITRNESLYLAVPNNNPFSALSQIRIKDVKGLPFVALVPSSILDAFESLCKKNGFDPNIVITCDDFQGLQRYILSGAGVTVTTSYSWMDMADRNLSFIKMDAEITQTIYAYWSGKKAVPSEWNLLFEKLLEFCKTELK